MESVASMDEVDKDIMSQSFGDTPWVCDAGTLTWCNRPRLYWITWELKLLGKGVEATGRELRLIGIIPGRIPVISDLHYFKAQSKSWTPTSWSSGL